MLEAPYLKLFLDYALEVARASGATYAEARIVESQTQSIETKDTALVGIDEGTAYGIGVRVLWDNRGWGFASSPQVSKRGILRAVRRACAGAKVSASLAGSAIDFCPEPARTATWSSPCQIDPFTVPMTEKIDVLISAAAAMRRVKKIQTATGSLEFRRQVTHFANSEGTYLVQNITTSGCEIQATALDDGDTQLRSYPFCEGGQYETRGFEMVKRWDLPGNARRIGEEAVAILRAPLCPERTTDVIIGSAQMAMQLHESCGHACELDREDGWELNYAGGTFLTRDKLGHYKYGSPLVNIVADATTPGGLGTFGFDDEGVEAQRYHLVKNGIFTGYLSSRQTAGIAGLTRSGGAMRAAGYEYSPLIRMTNVNLLPGDAGSLEDLIADTSSGIFLDTCTSWSIDSQREHFQFSTEDGWEIKNGKRKRRIRMPRYEGFTTRFWRSCNAICGPSEWQIWGCDTCSKGQPEQSIGTGHGASPARFRKVKVGPAQ